jgi:hypothetical protein
VPDYLDQMAGGPFRWMCPLCKDLPFDGIGAHGHASSEEAGKAGMRHARIRHPTQRGKVLIAVIQVNPNTKLKPVPPGPYVGHCGICQKVVVGPYASFNDADDYLEAHRWQKHADRKDVVLVVGVG